MGKRHEGHAFMPGKFVFPGGRVEPEDRRMAAAGALDPHVEDKLNLRVPRPSPGFARAIALAAIRETFEETGLAIGVGDYGAPEDAAARRLDPLRRDGRLSGARRHRLPRPRDHSAGAGQAFRRALSPRRRQRCRAAGRRRHSPGGGTGRSRLDAARRGRASWTCPTSPGSRLTILRQALERRPRPPQATALLSRAPRQAAARGSCEPDLSAAARAGPQPSGELHQREMIGPRGAMRAVVAGIDDVEQFDHDLGVDLGQMIEGQAHVSERGDQRLARRASNSVMSPLIERSPDARVQARQSARLPLRS